jgi:phosphoserine phosphatase
MVNLRFIHQLHIKKQRNKAVFSSITRKNMRTFELPAMNNPRLHLVSFDLDGTILRGRILDYAKMPEALHRKIADHDRLMFRGELGYEESLQLEFALFAGMKLSEIMPDPEKLPLIKDLDATIQALSRSGVRSVILTDNPSFAAEPLRKHGFRDIIASEVETSNGILTDRLKLLTNKLEGLREYCRQHDIELASCAHVGDWTNDLVVFKAVGVSVALNSSDESVSRAATYTVNSDSLLDVYRVLEPNLPARLARL